MMRLVTTSIARCTWSALCMLNAAGVVFSADRLDVDAQVLQAQQQRVTAMRRASAATISIFGLDGGGGGSGVIVSPDGYALTNYHVSSACGDHMRCGLNDGRMYDAVIVGIDATGDVSLIRLLGRDDFPTAPLADSSQVRVGQWCFAAGNPFVLATNLQPSVSLGIVSGVNRYQYPAGTLLEYADCIQTDAAINPGNSGGPLFNLQGQVIGINGRCSFEKRSRINVGVGYAISSNQVKYFMGVLRSGRLVDHATMGATVSTDSTGRIVVSNILSSSDAYRRGLRYGDEVLELADREVRTTNMFKNILGTLPRDWRVPLVIRRNRETRTLLVRLDGVHSEKELLDLVSGEMPAGHPTPEQRKERPGDTPESPDNQPSRESAADPAAPEADTLPPELRHLIPNTKLAQSMLESRQGFANYYFNRMHQERIAAQIGELGNYRATSDEWTLSGTLAGEKTEFSIVCSPDDALFQLGSRKLGVDFSQSLSDVVAAHRETGLLVALRALQQLLRQGPQKMGETIYMGTMPCYTTTATRLSDQPLEDVLRILWYDAKVRFTTTAEGQVRLVEVFGDAGDDPIEMVCDRYTSFTHAGQQIQFPGRLRLRYGMETVLMLDVQQLQTARPATIQDGAAANQAGAAGDGASE